MSWARAQIGWQRHFLGVSAIFQAGTDFSHKIGKIWTNNPTRVISEKLLSNLFRHCPTKIIELHYGSSLGVVYVFWRQHVKGQQFFSDLAASKVWWLPVWAKLGHLGWDAGQALAAGALTFIIMVDIDHHGWEDAGAFLPRLPLDMPLTSKTIICIICPDMWPDNVFQIQYALFHI